jgi:hypothetical protein
LIEELSSGDEGDGDSHHYRAAHHRQRDDGNDPERQQFLDLGIDADIVDSDRDLARVLAESIMIDREENREREEQKKRE